MQSVELSGIEYAKPGRRPALRSASSHLRIVLMLCIWGFPAMSLYSIGSSQKAIAHTRASATVAKVRVSRAPGTLMLVRSPLPPPVQPKPVSTPER